MKKNIAFLLASLVCITACANREVAEVNGRIIYESEIIELEKKVGEDIVKQLGKNAVRKNLLEGLIEQQLLLSAIRDAGFEKKAGVLDGWQPLKREMSIKYFLNEFLPKKDPMPKSRLKEAYEKKKELFKSDGQVRASHILIRTGEGNHGNAEALTIIRPVIAMIKQDGSNFGELARRYSECPSAKDGGDLGYIGRDQMVRPFEDAIYSMKKGEFTHEPVRTVFGYHIIYIVDVKPSTYASFDDVKSSLGSELHLADITASYGIKVYPDALKKGRFSTPVGAIEKMKLTYTYGDFIRELDITLGKAGAAILLKDGKETAHAVRELLVGRALEDKSSIMKMQEDVEYRRYIGAVYDDYISREFLNSTLLNGISVSDTDVAALYDNPRTKKILEKQYGIEYRDNPAVRLRRDREEVLPGLRRQLVNEKKNNAYTKYIAALKEKYPVNIMVTFE